MAHFAEIDTDTSTVIRVLVVHNDITYLDGVEDEQRGIDFLEDTLPGSGPWVQTSYNNNFRHNYAGAGERRLLRAAAVPVVVAGRELRLAATHPVPRRRPPLPVG